MRSREFPVTREIVQAMGTWVNQAAAPLLPAIRVPDGTSFVWRFKEESPRVLVFSKSVRVASGLNAAQLLLDAAAVTEAAALLRIVSDLSVEMIAVCEGGMREQPTRAQADFTSQFFERNVTGTPDDAAKRRYVGRDELLKAHDRLAAEIGLNEREFSHLIRRVNFALDGYVHGSYSSSMELYHGGRHEFMVAGHEGVDELPIHRVSLALATSDALVAFSFMATMLGDIELAGQLDVARKALNLSRELELDDPGRSASVGQAHPADCTNL